MRNDFERNLIVIAGLVGLSLACTLSGQGTAIPAGRPVDFDVQTATPTIDPKQNTIEPEEIQSEPVLIVPLGDAPTHTPDPNATSTRPPLPTNTPTLVVPTTTLTEAVEIEQTPSIQSSTPISIVAVSPTRVVEPDPPLQGGEWDFETDFSLWANPYGEPCPGSSVASGWTAFVEQGEFGSSCMNENLYQPNVFSGRKSQEITFDFIASNSGVFRTIPAKVGHRYTITAYAKHDRSLAPVQMFLGVDLTGGTAWQAETVQWFPWSSGLEDTWIATEETVTATGESMTIFIRGHHPVAEQGGKTVIDNVSVTDLGL
jgi:hypothetical protein